MEANVTDIILGHGESRTVFLTSKYRVRIKPEKKMTVLLSNTSMGYVSVCGRPNGMVYYEMCPSATTLLPEQEDDFYLILGEHSPNAKVYAVLLFGGDPREEIARA